MIACPACKRHVFTHREMLYSGLDGRVACPACDELACLDQTSRCLVTGVLALFLWMLLLHGDFFYSDCLFIVSTIVIVIGWRLLCAAGLPLLTLEKAPGHGSFDRRQNLVTLAILIVTAVAIDGLMAYRSDADKRHATATSVSEGARSQ